MDVLDKQAIIDLAGDDSGVCLSFYMPTYHAGGREIRQNSIRLKNLIAKAETKVAKFDRFSQTMQERLTLPQALLGDEDFWKHQGEGLALFLSSETWLYYRLPMTVDEQLVAGERFFILPLLDAISYTQPFYILAVSQHEVKFYQGDRYQLRELHPEGMPRTKEEATWFREEDKKLLNFRQAAPRANQTDRAGSYHGHGDDSHQVDPALAIFLRQVDKAISRPLKLKRFPLIVIGVEPTTGYFQKISDYPHLHAVIHDNPTALNENELHERVLTEVSQMLDWRNREAAGRYHQLAGNGSRLAMDDPAKIVAAASEGRIDTLLLAENADRPPGFYERLEPGAARDRLLNEAAIDTLKNSGEVLVVSPAELSDRAGAILRY